MLNKIKFSPISLHDLDEIWDYIALELCNLNAAENTVNGIMEIVEELKQFTGIGARLYFEDGMDSGYRFVQYKNYIAFYHIIGTTAYVDRVIYCKRDYMRALFPEKPEDSI